MHSKHDGYCYQSTARNVLIVDTIEYLRDNTLIEERDVEKRRTKNLININKLDPAAHAPYKLKVQPGDEGKAKTECRVCILLP